MYTVEMLVSLNAEIFKSDTGKAGFQFPPDKGKAKLEAIVEQANQLPGPYDSAAYLALRIYSEQPFKDGNTRLAAAAIVAELKHQAKTVSRGVDEIREWLTDHEIQNLQDQNARSDRTLNEFKAWIQ